MGTYTYTILGISKPAFEEISELLKAAGYGHVFHMDDGRLVMDMHGIALAVNTETERGSEALKRK